MPGTTYNMVAGLASGQPLNKCICIFSQVFFRGPEYPPKIWQSLLGGVHKWRHHFWGVLWPPLPLVIIRHFLATPPSSRAELAIKLILRQNTVCWVPEHSWWPFTTKIKHTGCFLVKKKKKYWGCNNWWLKMIIESYCRHTSYLLFFLNGQDLSSQNFTPKSV